MGRKLPLAFNLPVEEGEYIGTVKKYRKSLMKNMKCKSGFCLC
jgi:hypothetical protein